MAASMRTFLTLQLQQVLVKRVLGNSLLRQSNVSFSTKQSQNSQKKHRRRLGAENTAGQKKIDPRQSVQYPFMIGDPIQQSVIDNLEKPTETDAPIQKKVQKIKTLNNVFKTSSGLVYEKLNEGDIRLGRSLMNAKLHQPGSSSTSKTILLEGVRLIRDALLLGAEAQALYFTDVSILDQLPLKHLEQLKLYKILYRDMKTWSDTTSPSGILGIFKQPDQGSVCAPCETSLPITVILDSLKDPGNVGTLIRTAAAVGCRQILSTRGTVNLWDGKVLRSSMGGHISVPLYWGLPWSDIHNYLSGQNTQVFLADTQAGRTLARAFDSELDISQLEGTENNAEESDSDNDEEVSLKLTDKDRREETMAYKFHKVPMTVFDYSQLQLLTESQNSAEMELPNVAIVLGGETEGLSAQAKKFAFDHYGHYVTIPMSSTVNSLNTGVAGSILLYEIRRQLLELERSNGSSG